MTIGLAIVYLGMVLFDFAMYAGCAYLVAFEGWSGWWFLLAYVFTHGNDPRYLLREAQPKNTVVYGTTGSGGRFHIKSGTDEGKSDPPKVEA